MNQHLSHSFMRLSKSLVLLFLLSAIPGICQTASTDNEEKPIPQICVITVGSPAGNIAEWKSDTVFSFRPTDEGASPPMDLYYQKSEKGKRSYHLLPFGLGRSTSPIEAPQSPLVLFKRAESSEGKSSYIPDFQLPVKASSLTAAILWRDKKHPNWKKPNILCIDASPEAWPPGEVRFLNLSPVAMGLTLNDGRVKLDPMAIHASRVAIGEPFPYKIEAAVKDKMLFVCRTAVSMTSPRRTLVVMFGNQKGEMESMSIAIPMPIPPLSAESGAKISDAGA